jgi:drug/metabolite transporter (DMT)-like permease
MPRFSVILLFAGAAIAYAVSAYITYHKWWKDSSWLYPTGIMISVIMSVIWYTLVRIIRDDHDLYIASNIWDALITLVFTIIPIIFFHIRPDWKTWAGITMIIMGTLVLKLTHKTEKEAQNTQATAVESGESPPAPAD